MSPPWSSSQRESPEYIPLFGVNFSNTACFPHLWVWLLYQSPYLFDSFEPDCQAKCFHFGTSKVEQLSFLCIRQGNSPSGVDTLKERVPDWLAASQLWGTPVVWFPPSSFWKVTSSDVTAFPYSRINSQFSRVNQRFLSLVRDLKFSKPATSR